MTNAAKLSGHRKLRSVLAMIASIFALAAITGSKAATAQAEDVVFIGTQGSSVLAARFDAKTGRLHAPTPAASVERPTWVEVSVEKKLLFAVSEIGNYDAQRGHVHSFRISSGDGLLTPVSTVDSGGGGPTFVSYAKGSLFVANFGSGHVAAMRVAANGRILPNPSIQLQSGSGPLEKQKSAHPHATALDPRGRWLLVPDMGADRIFVYRTGRHGGLNPAPELSVFTGPGTGPRHITFSRNGRYVYLVTEHSAEVRVFGWSSRDGSLIPQQSISLDPPDATARSAAEIAASPDGRFLYVSNRAHDLIHVFAIDRRDGRLRQIEAVSSGGKRPRSFAIHPDGGWMIVGNQDSQTITIMAINPVTGRLTQIGAACPVPEKPVSFAFLPAPRQPR